jgi:hypothetical protein
MQSHTSSYQPAGFSGHHRNILSLSMDFLLLAILPLLSVAGEQHFVNASISIILLGKWFLFWTIGVRLMVKGFAQVIRSVRNGNSSLLNRDETGDFTKMLGLAKMALAGMGFLCVVNDQWSLLATITVGVYLGLTGFQHDFKRPTTTRGWMSMSYDFLVFTVIAVCLVF